MPTIVDSVEARIAIRLRERRAALGISLAELATRSGVSKAMIARVEAGEASPTTGLLWRLCSGLGVSLSTLMISVETPTTGHFAAAEQPTWTDPESGLERTVVASGLPETNVEIVRVRLRPGTDIRYDLPPAPPLRQHIIMLAGSLAFTIGEQVTELAPGDCLFAVIDRPTRFVTPGESGAEYLVVQQPW